MIQCFERFDEATCNKEVMALPEQSLDNQLKRKAIAVEVGGKSTNCVFYIVFYPLLSLANFFHFDSMTILPSMPSHLARVHWLAHPCIALTANIKRDFAMQCVPHVFAAEISGHPNIPFLASRA